MDYRGYKIKETTSIGAFDVPRKMLVWGELGKGKDETPKVDTVSARVRLDAGACGPHRALELVPHQGLCPV